MLLINIANIVVNMDISVRLSCFPLHVDKTYVFITGMNDIIIIVLDESMNVKHD